MKQIAVLLSTLFLFSVTVCAQEITDKIQEAFETADANMLSDHFNQNIELIIDGSSEIYNKSQAEMIMKDFFHKNKPTAFNKIHQGDKDSSIFLICKLSTENSIFRVSFLLKKTNNTFLIHQIRIQND